MTQSFLLFAQSDVAITLWLEIAKQIPALVALIWIVYQFMKHLRELNSERMKEISARDAVIKGITDSDHDFHDELTSRTKEFIDQISNRGETALARMSEACTLMATTTTKTLVITERCERALLDVEKSLHSGGKGSRP